MRVDTGNPGAMRGDGTLTSVERQLGELRVAVLGVQEARDKDAWVKELGGCWYLAASACESRGLMSSHSTLSMLCWMSDGTNGRMQHL